MLHPKRFEEIKGSRQLPSPTGVVMTLLRLTDDENSTVEDITRVLQSDPALAGRILKYANSVYVGTTRPVVAVQEAVSRLGMRAVCRLALGFSLVTRYGSGTCKHFPYQDYWSRSLATAIAAQMLSRLTRKGNSDEIFVGGLLGEVGALGLATLHPDAYSEVLERAEGLPRAELLRRQRQAFAMDQSDLTAAMLDDWRLPEEYIAGIRALDRVDPNEAAPNSGSEIVTELLGMARLLGLYCTSTDEDRPAHADSLLDQASRLEIDTAAFCLLGEQTVRVWHDWGRMMNIPTSPVPALGGVARSARPAEVGLPGAPGLADRVRVLVADADPGCIAGLTADLSAAGYEVLGTGSGTEALQIALETRPPLILAGWQLRDMHGLEFGRLLRQSRPGQQTYLILLTGAEGDDQVVAALDAGADDYCVRPWNPRILAARLRAGERAVELQRALEREKEEVREVVARLAVANRMLEASANTDSLTGLPNRAYAREALLSSWELSVQGNRPLTCMMLDIDHFKRVNDTYGHDVGDLVLQRTAQAMRSNVRASDAICRLGGEEFLLICRQTSAREGLLAAERLRAAVAGNKIQAPGFNGTVTISIGLAERTALMSHPDELLKEADLAVYAAKHAGRNCVRTAGQTSAPVIPPVAPSAPGVRRQVRV